MIGDTTGPWKLHEDCGFWEILRVCLWVPYFFEIGARFEDVRLCELEPDKPYRWILARHQLSNVTSVPFFHLPEHSEDGNVCFTGLSDTMSRETQNGAGHVGGARCLAAFTAVTIIWSSWLGIFLFSIRFKSHFRGSGLLDMDPVGYQIGVDLITREWYPK